MSGGDTAGWGKGSYSRRAGARVSHTCVASVLLNVRMSGSTPGPCEASSHDNTMSLVGFGVRIQALNPGSVTA